ncbi:MAG: MBL fold metallo-hydrolase [Methanotrichaceae archaeon]|nr:MBL fold metallo-hydrolase [Methanotrichaceae archaeon]
MSTFMPSVFFLKPGSIKRDECGRILDARSSVTLIVSGRHRIVVDSGLLGEEETINKALAELCIKPEEIDYVVNTHSHSDHCGNNHLFSRAKVLAAKDGDMIASGVWVLATPGHSMDSISVVVETNLESNGSLSNGSVSNGSVVIVIAGDALPTFGNFQKKVPPALHVNRDLAMASMKRIMKIADFVVPGHDFPFSIRKEAYVLLPFRIGPERGKCRL